MKDGVEMRIEMMGMVREKERVRVEMMVDVRVRIGMKILNRVWMKDSDREKCKEKSKYSRDGEKSGIERGLG